MHLFTGQLSSFLLHNTKQTFLSFDSFLFYALATIFDMIVLKQSYAPVKQLRHIHVNYVDADSSTN